MNPELRKPRLESSRKLQIYLTSSLKRRTFFSAPRTKESIFQMKDRGRQPPLCLKKIKIDFFSSKFISSLFPLPQLRRLSNKSVTPNDFERWSFKMCVRERMRQREREIV